MAPGVQSFLLLPPEIIVLIFEHCLPFSSYPWHRWSSSSFDHLRPSPSKAPLLLAQICRRWREICLDAPSLWASIAFGDTGSIDFLEMWLSRARGHRLRIHLQTQDDDRGELLAQVVKRHSSQWKELYFGLPTSTHEQLHMFTFACLERLTITYPGALTFGGAAVTTTECIALLRCCPNLLDFRCGPTASSAIVPPPLHLPFLRSLKLTDGKMLHYLTVPRLIRLHISRVAGQNSTANALQALVARSRCDVRYLSTGPNSHVYFDTADQLQRILNVVNDSILHLRLHSESASELETQIEVLGGDDVLPRLKHLEMRTTVVPDDYAILLGIMRRRQRDSLESFELLLDLNPLLRAPCTPSSLDMGRFRTLADTGLGVSIRRRFKDDVYFTPLDTITRPALDF
ncbi:hypothetical protein DFH06DRAFT_581053 [Mycena polygramma]|nr:hypothetical protein DFH06DRAFT_581053 [Mycena polygramma]